MKTPRNARFRNPIDRENGLEPLRYEQITTTPGRADGRYKFWARITMHEGQEENGLTG